MEVVPVPQERGASPTDDGSSYLDSLPDLSVKSESQFIDNTAAYQKNGITRRNTSRPRSPETPEGSPNRQSPRSPEESGQGSHRRSLSAVMKGIIGAFKN